MIKTESEKPSMNDSPSIIGKILLFLLQGIRKVILFIVIMIFTFFVMYAIKSVILDVDAFPDMHIDDFLGFVLYLIELPFQ